jgi:hypothetical protein
VRPSQTPARLIRKPVHARVNQPSTRAPVEPPPGSTNARCIVPTGLARRSVLSSAFLSPSRVDGVDPAFPLAYESTEHGPPWACIDWKGPTLGELRGSSRVRLSVNHGEIIVLVGLEMQRGKTSGPTRHLRGSRVVHKYPCLASLILETRNKDQSAAVRVIRARVPSQSHSPLDYIRQRPNILTINTASRRHVSRL